MDGSGHDREAQLAGMQGRLEQVETCATEAERLVLSTGASFLLAMLQLGRGITAIGAGRHLEAFEHLQRLFAPADPAFNSGLQFFALADFVEAAVYSDHSQDARKLIDEVERVSDPDPVPWVATMLCYGKALIATNEEAEQYFMKGLGPAAKNWPFLRGRLLLGYGAWLRRQRRSSDRGRRCVRPAISSTRSALHPGAIARGRSCAQPARQAFAGQHRFGKV